MTAVPGAADFEQALGDLQEHLPDWWAVQNEGTEAYLMAQALGAQLDGLSVLAEQPYLDQVITNASLDGLYRNFALAWGLENEQLPSVVSALVAIIQARATDDGSDAAFIRALDALLETNLNFGTVLTFPSGGSGITIPALPTTLILYEFSSTPVFALTFAINGTGLTFPANGSGLAIGDFAWVNFLPDFATYTLTIQVLNYLVYDSGALQRIVEEYQMGDWLPTVIQSVAHF